MLYYLCSMKTLNGIFCGKLTTFLMLCSMLGILVSCTSVDDNSGGVSPQYTGMPRVIYDTDLGSSTDDLIALRLLYNYAKEGRCKLLGIVVDREGEDCAAVADVMNTYYGYGSLPIGLERNGVKDPHVFIDYRGLYKHTTAQGDLMFNRTISDISWTDIHPIKQVYMTYNCLTGQKMWDPLAVIQAVEGDALFTLSERGIVSLTEHFGTEFTPSPTGNCRYQKPASEAWFTTMLDKMRVIGRP